MLHCGVEAPAIIPTIFPCLRTPLSISFTSSTHIVLLQFFLEISYNFLVFELFFPPTIIIQSTFLDSSSVSSCLILVALHIVFTTSIFSKFLNFFFILSVISVNFCKLNVVWTTIASFFLFDFLKLSIDILISSMFSIILTSSPQKLAVPIIYGCFFEPTKNM